MFIVQILGNLGKDPEVRFTPSGQKVTAFNVATKHRKGKENVTIWVRVTIWGDRFDKMISYLKKGSGVVVVGRMNPPSSYTDKEGRAQFSLEVTADNIEFLPSGKSDQQADGQQGHGSHSYQGDQGHGSGHAGYEDALQPSGASAYGRGSYPSTGQGSHSNSAEDDTLPF